MFCQGAALDLARLNLNLRTGERVLLVLGSFPAQDFDALFEGTRALPWERFIPREGQFPVKGHSLNSALHSGARLPVIVKKAIAARLGAKYGLNTCRRPGPSIRCSSPSWGTRRPDAGHLRGGAPQAGLPGPGGGRPPAGDPGGGHGDPVRYRGRDPLCDPFCGSGTIPIEAALIAKKPGPRPEPHLSAQKWPSWTRSCGSRRRTRPWIGSSWGL